MNKNKKYFIDETYYSTYKCVNRKRKNESNCSVLDGDVSENIFLLKI